MKKYEFLPHTADAKFRAYGKTLDEAFKNASYAMTDVITDHEKVKTGVKKQFSIESEDEKSLLYDFLEKFLILLDSEGFLLNKIIDIKIMKKKRGLSLTASLIGDNHPERYETKTTIKAVTYQEMEIEKSKEGFMLQVVVDI